VPQDIQNDRSLWGKDKFEAKLDEMFNSESKTTGREQVDVTGLANMHTETSQVTACV
jgi:hypothetical protein